jgi:hypothetical protein
LGQRRRIDDLNLFHVVDEQVEAGLPAAACRAYSVSRPLRPDQRDPPADDRTAEGDVDDEDDPTVRVVAPECEQRRGGIDGADDQQDDRPRLKGATWVLRADR